MRERAIAPNVAKSSSPIANSIACRHPAMTSILVPESSSEATSHVSKNESSAYDRFHRIDELVRGGCAMTEGQSVTAKTLLNFQIAQLVSHPDILVLTMIVDDGEHPFALDLPIA